MRRRRGMYLALAAFCGIVVGALRMEVKAEEALYPPRDVIVEVGVKDTVGGHALDIGKYRAAYPDLEEAFGDDLDRYVMHYVYCGIHEGRDNFEEFEPIAYADANPDVREAFGYEKTDLILHYLRFGIRQNRPLRPAKREDMVRPLVIVVYPVGVDEAEEGAQKGSACPWEARAPQPPPDGGDDSAPDVGFVIEKMLWMSNTFTNWIWASSAQRGDTVDDRLDTRIVLVDKDGGQIITTVAWEWSDGDEIKDGTFSEAGTYVFKGVLSAEGVDAADVQPIYCTITVGEDARAGSGAGVAQADAKDPADGEYVPAPTAARAAQEAAASRGMVIRGTELDETDCGGAEKREAARTQEKPPEEALVEERPPEEQLREEALVEEHPPEEQPRTQEEALSDFAALPPAGVHPVSTATP